MKKVFFLIAFLFLTAANTAVVYVALSDEYENVEMPIGDSEENKDVSEEDDDEVALDFRWISNDQSTNSNLHILYQEILFNNLELEVVVPPPKG
jgi:hypothetical protein